MNTASWVIREKATGVVLFETFNQKVVEAINTERYEAVPAQQYLASLNDQTRTITFSPSFSRSA
jgi:hypothetical protein